MDPILFPFRYNRLDFRSLSRKRRQVFIVHGHDIDLRDELCLFLYRLNLEPIVLNEQTDKGLTIIEKFEKHSKAGYAVILLTPDDIGFVKTELQKSDKERNISYRARQNVIFEMGYFIGKLGRSKVCCIYKKGVEIPSDLKGIAYKKIEESINEVSFSFAKELRAAGMAINL